MKYVGIWWGMHIGTMTWSSGPKHGATTANTKRYIDFAAANGFGGVLVEGWNTGLGRRLDREPRTPSPSPRPIPTTTSPRSRAYAQEKGVRLIVHNETSGGIQNYERQLDSAFALYRSLGLDAIKTGYVTDTDRRGPLALVAVHGAALPPGDRDGRHATASCWTSTSRCTTPASAAPSRT